MSNEHAFAVVMAGGHGTRFWPLSRRARPKQLLALGPDATPLLTATVERAGRVVPLERTLIVTSRELVPGVTAVLPNLPPSNLLAEPRGRNTAPCIAWAAAHAAARDPDAVLLVIPSDHHIADPDEFVRILESGLRAATDGSLVTVGIRPTRPETGYGYIELGDVDATGVHTVRRFVEKPSKDAAEAFLATGQFLWNSGMFFFRADAILAAIHRYLPTLGAAIDELSKAIGAGREHEVLDRIFDAIESVSIDHGVMEAADQVRVIPASFGWSDLGSWLTAWELGAQDAEGNVSQARTLLVDASGCLIHSTTKKLVAAIGVSDLVIVDTEDALLIVPRERCQEVRRVIAALEQAGETELL